MNLNHGAHPIMANQQNSQPASKSQRVALTARLSLDAYDAIVALQRQHRVRTGKALPIWKIMDAAILAYAKQQKDVKEAGE
jgi:hypothetical protein